jgi:hypothetical protein
MTYLDASEVRVVNTTRNVASVLAFDFYDGPTEGIAREVLGAGPCYFKMIAWDEQQDVRLFGVVAIDERVFQRWVETVARNSPNSSASVQLVTHTFPLTSTDGNLEMELEKWIEQLPQSGFLVCGTAVDSLDARRYSIPESMGMRFTEAMKSNAPESLSDWRSHLM